MGISYSGRMCSGGVAMHERNFTGNDTENRDLWVMTAIETEQLAASLLEAAQKWKDGEYGRLLERKKKLELQLKTVSDELAVITKTIDANRK